MTTPWKLDKDRKHPLKTLAWAEMAFPRYRKKREDATQFYPNGNLYSTAVPDISIIQAARDGLLDIVLAHLRLGVSHLYDVDEDGYTALHHATRYNRVNVLEVLIDAGADVNVRAAQDESTPLHMACRYNSGSVTQLLLTQGAEVNVRDIKGKTPLHYATRRGNDVPTKMLLSVSSCDVNVPDNDHTTPLIMAAMQGNRDMVEILLSRGARPAQADINDMNPMMWAAAEGHVGVADLLLRAALRRGEGYQKQYIEAQDNEGSTALMLAVQKGSLAVCKLLLNHFANVNCYKNNLTTPLHMASSNGYLDIAKLLIFRGASVNRKDTEQMTPVHKAALHNKVDIIMLLVEYGADLNAKDKKNMSPLHCASWKGQKDTVQYLLENGAQVAEADSSLKTALHWTVQFGHYDTLAILLAHGGTNMLEATDKNDQTILHYAAYIGNVSVLHMLLECGTRPDAKDQEERTSLHISAEYNNVSCVEALIDVSNREINDDDVDGNTPLLTACLNGHYQVVQLLLSLGGDVSKTDDEHRTALMLAATGGHTSVMKILLDNQASLNDVDKMKNTALHYACMGGHIEAVQLLLDRRADVTVKNTHEQAPLDLAIDNLHGEVTMTMLIHKSWRDMLNVRDKKGLTALDRLIEKLPESAQIVLDHCVERSSRDDDDPTLALIFDYQYIDPGPEDPACEHKRYFALNTMVEHHRDILLSHPLCQSLLSQKWVRFGRTTFTINLLIYLGYLISLTFYVFNVESGLPRNGTCNDKDLSKQEGNMTATHCCPGDVTSGVLIVGYVLLLFVVIFLVREVTKFFHQRVRYLFNFFNLIPWVMMIATCVFIYGFKSPCLVQWRGAWVALFLAWINFIMYLRRIDFVGIYVIMFVAVLTSLLKAIFMFLLFICAFTGSFYIVLSSNTPVFQNLWTAMLNIFVMTLGEIQYVEEYGEKLDGNPFEDDINFLLLIFLFIMPIVLMNLMIGIAVGDIEKIQHNAYLKRIALQVELLYQLESSLPTFLQKRAYVRRVTIKPNNDGEQSDFCQKLWRNLFGSSRNVQFIQAERKDRVTGTLDKLREQMSQQQQRIRSMQISIQQQASVLQKIACKLDVDNDEDLMAEPPGGVVYPHSDIGGSIYDGLEAGSLIGGLITSPGYQDQRRQKSIRISADRPRSIVI